MNTITLYEYRRVSALTNAQVIWSEHKPELPGFWNPTGRSTEAPINQGEPNE